MVFYGLQEDEFKELEQNLRTHLSIPPTVEVDEFSDGSDGLAVTFKLNEDDNLTIDATADEITSIRLWGLSGEEGSYELYLTEDAARALFFDLNQHLPIYRQFAFREQASDDEESISDEEMIQKMIELYDQSEGMFRPVDMNEVNKRIQERKKARLQARRMRQEKAKAKKK